MTVKELWNSLGDVPIDDDECTETPWLHFSKGTAREDIWHWFEYTFDLSVGEDLMYG